MSAVVALRDPVGVAGLVSVSTTHTGLPETLKVEHDEARWVRLQKAVGVAAKLHHMETQGGGWQCLFVTLTYRNGDDWRGTHMTRYLTAVRNHHRRKTGHGLRYVWVGETQERGAIHYHLIFWVRRSYFMPKADARGWWPHGMTNTQKARHLGGSVAYLMAYIKKQKSKEGLPHGARIFGVGGLSDVGRRVRRWIHFPAFVQARADVATDVTRATGGGWIVAGVRYLSEWGVSAIGRGYTRLLRLRAYPPTGIQPVGPYSFIPAGVAAAA